MVSHKFWIGTTKVFLIKLEMLTSKSSSSERSQILVLIRQFSTLDWSYNWYYDCGHNMSGMTRSQMFGCNVSMLTCADLSLYLYISRWRYAPLVVPSFALGEFWSIIGTSKADMPPSWQGGVPKSSWVLIANLVKGI